VIWANCIELLHESDVYFVTADKAFYEGRDYAKGLAKNLLKEALTASHQIHVMPKLGELLRNIQSTVKIDKNKLIEEILRLRSESVLGMLDRAGYELGNEPSVELRLYATEVSTQIYLWRKNIPMGNRHSSRSIVCYVTISALCLMIASSASAIEIDLEPPGDREFIRDFAGLLDSDSEEHIRKLCDSLLTDKATPIIVITIESMAKHGGEDMRIETFATLLFDQWRIGHATLGKLEWNTGILLLVSRDDRKARIELGGGWGRREDALCRQIMDEHIIFRFKQGQFSEGIVAGVEALDKMGRKLKLPTRPRPWWHYALVVGFIGLAIFTTVSLVRRGASGWAWIFWGVVFALVGTILYQMMTSRGNGGGGFGGGSFGGGSSGGGGATGSW